ncbi:virulence factor SrfC family protein [Erwinia psidii]|uniref:Virulence factor n=1 Tax=Erwinia psidii TaxID=69224 RepID=A0A3N6S1L7_9GAMM|nr:virulence factor SrfC family protein [Erwinia psidii]MCX8956008.1 virulence factor [Erwinia psidii]MCX8961382.1 virulence factor [Erwinia psidii]RQM38717.1 virulence factor [Erwinia psidii]
MKALTPKQLSGQFGKKLATLAKSISGATDWLESARENAPRLDMEADRLHIRLMRQRNKVGYLTEAAAKECAIGFFGLSQAGKSYLISALAASEKGRMEIALGGTTLDYRQLNPQQQTGTMVLRISGQQARIDNEWPVRLTLLSEGELVAIIADMYARRDDTPSFLLDEQQITERLKATAMYRQNQPTGGISDNQVVALWDRLATVKRCCDKALESHFWPQAVEMAPLLGVDDRARLFSLLWGEDRALSNLYRQLAHVLHHVSGAAVVLAPQSTLEDPALSVLSSHSLRHFNTATDRVIQVIPQQNNRSLKPVNLALSELTLLSREVLLPLYSAPRESLFEQVDLLDYPGFEEPAALPDNSQHTLALRFLTAKRPFLLTRTADHYDVSLLMVCSASSQRADTRVVGRALENWVKKNQGENSQIRRQRKPGLIWALTPYDQRILQGQNHDAAVQRFVGTPGDAWGSMLAMDDKGVKRMAGWLTNEVRRETRLEFLQEQANEIRRELADNLLGRWYLASEKEEPQARLRIAAALLKALQARTGVHGELLERLLPDRETLRHLFLQRRSPTLSVQGTEHALTEDDPFGIGISIDLLSDEPVPGLLNPEENLIEEKPGATFPRQVYHHWVNMLRQLPDRSVLLELLGVSKPTLEMLTEELVTASIRLDIESALVKMLTDDAAPGTPAEMIADRQVTRALSVLGDFVAWLGFQNQPESQRPESKINRGQPIFARPETQSASLGPGQRLTKLALKPNNHAACYIYDWLVGLNDMIVQNAGYSAAGEIDGEHRERLAALLRQIGR